MESLPLDIALDFIKWRQKINRNKLHGFLKPRGPGGNPIFGVIKESRKELKLNRKS
jgi:hypothetical protein